MADEWKELNEVFSWNPKDMGPYGWDLWGDISANYSKDAFGEIDIVQDVSKFPSGGVSWRGREWPTILNEGKVSFMNIFSMEESGNIIEQMRLAPDSDLAHKIFGDK